MLWFLIIPIGILLLTFTILFLILLYYKYKQAIGIEARKQALKEVILLLEDEANYLLEAAPKNRMFSVLSTKVMVLNHAKEKVQYLLDKTR